MDEKRNDKKVTTDENKLYNPDAAYYEEGQALESKTFRGGKESTNKDGTNR